MMANNLTYLTQCYRPDLE